MQDGCTVLGVLADSARDKVSQRLARGKYLAPTLIVNPLTDREFAAFAGEQAQEGAVPGDLQARLRERYPRASVRKRDLSGEPASVWYVYRDGSWTSGEQPTEG